MSNIFFFKPRGPFLLNDLSDEVSSDNKKIKIYDVNKYSNPLYLRLEVKDKPGVLSLSLIHI